MSEIQNRTEQATSVKRVALAIRAIRSGGVPPALERNPDGWRPYEAEARVAIAATREPTDTMIAAALEAMAAPPDAEDFKRGWRAAIDSLLKDDR